MYRRANARWTVNECLRLEIEFDLLKLSIEEIAALHERSTNAIMYKLDAEGIADYNDVFQNRQQKLKDEEQDEASVSEYEEDASVSEYEEEQEDEEQEEQEDEEQEEYDSYNVRQQIRSLTKQVANLTSIIYNAFTTKNNSNHFKGQSLAGFH